MNETEEIKSRLNSVDFIGEYVRLARAGSNYKGLCPFHNEKTPSFSVSEERQMFHCFGCGKGGDIFTFLMDMEGLEFREALEVLAQRAGVELKRAESGKWGAENGERIDTKRVLEALEMATKFFEKQLWEGEGRKAALPYLHDRAMKDEVLRTFRAGFAPEGWDHIGKFLASRGYTPQEIAATGLLVQRESPSHKTDHGTQSTDHQKGSGSNAPSSKLQASRSYDRFRARIMFPIFDALGRVIGYSARVLPGADEKGAKYINTPETPVYHKSRAIYGLAQAKDAIKREKKAILVEGNMDVLAMHQAGFAHSVAASGTALTEEHLKILARYAREVVFFFDMDDAGQAAARKATLLAYGLELPSSMVVIAGGKDAADMAKDHPKDLSSAIAEAKPSAQHFFDRAREANDLRTPEGKKRFAEEVLEIISAMKNEVEASHWMSRAADVLGVDIDALYAMLSRKKQRESRFSRYEEREVQPAVPLEEQEHRLARLSDRLSGWCFFFPSIWRGYAKEGGEALESVRDLGGDTLFSVIVARGEDAGFSFEELRLLIEDDALRLRAERAQHEIAMEQEEKPMTPQEAKEEAEYLFRQMEKEIAKERMHELERRLASSEDNREHPELLREMTELAKKIHSEA